MATTAAVLGPNTRLNNFRLAYLPAAVKPIRETRVLLWIDGVLARYRHGSMTIRDALNDTPNTCSFEVFAPVPPQTGERVRVTINSDDPRLLFAGAIQTEAVTFLGKPVHDVYPCNAVDDTWRAHRLLPLGAWENISASTVAAELVALFCPGFTANHIQPGLPAVTVYYDGSEGINGALTQLARLVGGYFYWEDSDLHFFQTEATAAPGVVTVGTFLHEPTIRRTSDDSQIRTRVYGKGYGITLPTAVLAGETILPILDTVLFASGAAIVFGVKASGSTTQRGTYTGVQGGGTGVQIGPGASPSVALKVRFDGAGGLTPLAAYQYRYTFVTGAGESLPGPVAGIVTYPRTADPTSALTFWSAGIGGPLTMGTHKWGYTFVTAYGETAMSPLITVNTANPSEWAYPTIPAGVVGTGYPILARRYYRTAVNSPTLRLVAEISGNAPVNYTDTTPDSGLGAAQAVAWNTTGATAFLPYDVPVGPTGTTARKIYRSLGNDTSTFRLQQTIANNTATVGVTDTTPDGSLGAAAPSSDTSGLQPPVGQVNAGSTSMLVAGAAALPAAGWLLTPARDYVRYTGISGTQVIGIPPSGPGSIVTSLNYGDPVLPAPALTGVAGITRLLEKGAPVHIWVQRDDLAAQAEMAARESTPTAAGDGIYEHLISDERRGLASLTALCDADLALFARPLVTVTYDTRDLNTKSGKTVTIDIADPAIHESLTIHDVTISELDIAPGLAPRFSVTASNVRFSLEDMLRRLTAQLDGSGG